MSKKPATLSDESILARVSAKAQSAVSWYESRLSKERERVLEYYNAKLPKRQHEGSSSYVSTDVYDSVEMMKAQLLETFAAGDDIAQFDPDQDMNAEQCRVATAYARHVIFRSNKGYSVFNDVIHDGLTARAGVARVVWDKKAEYVDSEFSNITFDEAQAYAAQDDVEEFDAEQNELTGLFDGTLSRKIDLSKITIDAVAPEEFLIEPRAVSIELADACHWRTRKSKAEMLSEGLNKAKVNSVKFDEATALDHAPEYMARHEPIESAFADSEAVQEEVAKVDFFESYVRMQLDKEKGVRLYRVLHTEDVMFEYQEVDKAPFFAYVPLPIPHLFYGNNFAARVIPTQNARTVLVRGILDHTAITTNPRWQVVKGGLINPREMLENRLGGIVNVNRPDSVSALQYANLNPYVFQTMQHLSENNEKSTGISALSQGLNKDAISKQNSQGALGDMVALSTQRQKIAARNFAYGFFVDIMMEVIRLTILNEKKAKVIEVAGNWETIDPRAWTERRTASVSMHLGYGEKDRAVGKLVETNNILSQHAGTMYTQENKYELFIDAMKLAGQNGTKYLTHPQKAEPQQPDPLAVKELEIKETQAQASLISAQGSAQKAMASAQIAEGQFALTTAKTSHDAANTDREAQRHDIETINRVDVTQREVALAERKPAESTHVSRA